MREPGDETVLPPGPNGRGQGFSIGDAVVAPGQAAAVPLFAPQPRRRPSTSAEIMADPETHEAIRRLVTESTLSYRAIGGRYGLRGSRVRDWAVRHAWPRPPGAPKAPTRRDGTPVARRPRPAESDIAAVRRRLVRAVDRQIARIEKGRQATDAAAGERDSRILANLAKTLATLTEKGEGGATRNRMELPDRDALEERLARKIERWAELGREDGGSAPGSGR
jgi:hypothetical protein